MPDLKPRKQPRQARARAGRDALLEATAHLLRESGYARLTTNHIAERAGVSIGTLYQLFPGKEAVVVALAEQRARKHFEAIVAELPEALAAGTPAAALDLLVRRIAKRLAADRRLYAVLLREVPFLHDLPQVRETVDSLIGIAGSHFARARGARRRRDAEIETRLIGKMAYATLIEIAVFRDGPGDAEELLDGFIRLLLRMLGGEGRG